MSHDEWTGLIRDVRDGKLRMVHPVPVARAGTKRVAIRLLGGPQDGGTYDCPAVYEGRDGLPDALMLWAGSRATLYVREKPADLTSAPIYRYRRPDPEQEPAHAAS